MNARTLVCSLAVFVSLSATVSLPAQNLYITEFLAANINGLHDNDGDASDWIELHNAGATSAALDGWYLTDDRFAPTKWRFPAVEISAGGYLVVFASGKNRAISGTPLHTSFALNSTGGYLALVRTDGITAASEFTYGPQSPDVSFGPGFGPSRTFEPLVGPAASLRYYIPEAPVAESWRGSSVFDDSSWSQGMFTAGYDLNTGAVTIAYFVPTNTPGNQAYGGGLGLDFDVVQPIIVGELGCFDDNGNSIADGTTITVSLWRRNNAGTPDVASDDTGTAILAATNFTSSSAGTLLSGSRFKTLATPLLLTNGSYTIVAYGYGANERLANLIAGVSVVTPNSGGGALRFVGRGRYGDNTAAFPGSADANVAQYGAGTFKFQTAPDSRFATSLAAMRGVNASVLLRVPFSVPAEARFASATLDIRFDDGFVAWLNGVEIARRNAPADSLPFDAAATAAVDAAITASIDLGAYAGELVPGGNILAIQALNAGAADADLHLQAMLSGERGASNAVYFLAATPGAANGAGLRFPRVTINEIHSDPLNAKSFPLEFIELFNPLPSAVDVSEWRFIRGVDYVFPPGTRIAANGFLVIAKDPVILQSRLGGNPLGPWIGSLANDGERLELVDASGATVDRVEYALGFPWPTVGDNDHSIQLIHEGLEHDLGGSWRSASPTPGARNSVTAGNAPPQIRQVDHFPREPRSGDAVFITARITDPDGVAGAALEYQVVTPGNYLRLTDPAFTNTWTVVAMRDDGTAGDPTAHDGLFTGIIAATNQMHRRLVRYRLRSTDSIGLEVRVPYADDPSPNFGYFVYDGVPAWTGAVQPGITLAATFQTDTTRKVRPYHLLSRSNDVWNCQYNATFNDGTYRFEAALVVDGKVYDHVRYRAKGQNSTYNTGKNKWKFKFNRGHWFELPDDYGQSHTTVEVLNVSSLPASWAPWNRGLAGLDEVMQYRLSNLAGVPAPRTAYFQLRVIDDPLEQPASQFDGDLWGLYLAFENQDNRFKDTHALPDGNIFRMQVTGAGNHLLGQGAGQPSDLRDLNAFVSPSTGYNRTPAQPEAWWQTNVDLARYYSWRAVNEAVNNTDIRDQENVVYFRDPTNGLWHIQPWDCDLLYEQLDRWGPEATQSTAPYEQIRRSLQHTNLFIEFQNRARELQDLLLNSDQAWKLVDEYVALITDRGTDQPGFVEVDRRRWDYRPENPVPPRGNGNVGNYYKNPYPIPNMGLGPPQPFFRTLPSADFAGCVTWTKNFIITDPHGGARLARLAEDSTIPLTPVLTYVGPPEFAADALTFKCSMFSSPASRPFAAMQWRVGEVRDPSVPNFVQGAPWRYEIEEVWDSGALASFSDQITLPPAFLREGHSYRVRVKFRDAAGRWSHWSEPMQFTPSSPGVLQLAQSLVLSEIMYNPPASGAISGDEFEFVELKNAGANALNLSGLSFSGLGFTFTNGTMLEPGAFFLLARNPMVFAMKYPGVAVNGAFSGGLDNGGEPLALTHSIGGQVFSLIYDDAAPWPIAPDNLGFSLVPVNPNANVDPNNPVYWRASAAVGGSPGADDPLPVVSPIVINEALTHSEIAGDYIELLNPTAAPVQVGGWFLTDDASAPKKFRIPPNTSISPGGTLVFGESQFNAVPGAPNQFSLNARGDDVYLFSGDAHTNLTGYSHGFSFGAAPDGVPFGRHVISTGEEQFPAQVAGTPNAPNTAPRVGPVVLSEIHYHPTPDSDEFVELRNVTATEVALNDPAAPTNRWRLNGLGYTFPPGFTLGAGQRLLLVAIDPGIFRARYSVPAQVQVLGPYVGQLQDSGERLELQRPDVPDTNGVAFITVDEVRYNDRSPWPFAADGSGASLQRRDDTAYGNDPANWQAAKPTPGINYPGGQAPTILAQPQSQSVLAGQSAGFRVNAAGRAPLAYQWAFNGSAVPGATASNLTFASVSTAEAGNYSVTVFNEAGSASSTVANLTVATPLLILTQPTNQFIRAGSNAVFRTLAVGTGTLRYQWRKNGIDLPGAMSTTLTILGAQLVDNGTYICVITDHRGPVTSQPALLAILIEPVITQQPLSQSIVPGSPVVLSVSVTNAATLPLGFRLRRNNSTVPPTVPNFFLIVSQTTVFITLTGTNAMLPWTNYAVVATNIARPGGLVSSNATLTYLLDSDSDGLPDSWENAYGFATNSPNATLDADNDGQSNGAEYLTGTDPLDPLSYLQIDALVALDAPPGAALRFYAVSNRTYTVQYNDSLESALWRSLEDVAARATNRLETILDATYRPSRFYRLTTPRQP